MPESNIISNYKNPKNNTTYINTSENININQNQNSSFQAFKPYKSLGAKKAYPSYKKAINLKDKETEKNIRNSRCRWNTRWLCCNGSSF